MSMSVKIKDYGILIIMQAEERETVSHNICCTISMYVYSDIDYYN